MRSYSFYRRNSGRKSSRLYQLGKRDCGMNIILCQCVAQTSEQYKVEIKQQLSTSEAKAEIQNDVNIFA